MSMDDIDIEARLMAATVMIKDFFDTDIEFDESWAIDAQHKISDCMDVLNFVNEEVDHDEATMTPSGYPYCGCPDCVTREALTMMTILVARGVRDGKVRLISV